MKVHRKCLEEVKKCLKVLRKCFAEVENVWKTSPKNVWKTPKKFLGGPCTTTKFLRPGGGSLRDLREEGSRSAPPAQRQPRATHPSEAHRTPRLPARTRASPPANPAPVATRTTRTSTQGSSGCNRNPRGRTSTTTDRRQKEPLHAARVEVAAREGARRKVHRRWICPLLVGGSRIHEETLEIVRARHGEETDAFSNVRRHD